MKNLLFTLFTMSLFFSFAQTVQDGKYQSMIDNLLSHNVTEVAVDEIDLNKRNIIFLDAREIEEYKVSHIKGATWVGYETFSMRNLIKIPKGAEIVVYCSVGYRSEKIAEQLIAKGYKNVVNLYGGLFEWSNQEKPLVDKQGNPTKDIHAYDKTWGQWISKGNKIYK